MAAPNENCTTWETFDTTLTADCVEFCPAPAFSSLLVCACYQLEEGNRAGRIYLQNVNKEKEEEEEEEEPKFSLKQEQTVDVSGVFDLKWDYHRKGDQLLASVHADGGLRLSRLGEKEKEGEGEKEKEKGYCLEEIECGKIEDGGMGLSVDWSGRVEGRGGDGKRLVVSYSDGSIAVWSVC